MLAAATRRLILWGIISVVVGAIVFWWMPIRMLSRAQRIKQHKPFVDGITMQVDDLYLYPEHNRANGGRDRDILRVRCRYLGGDPNDKYYLRGALLASPDGPELDYGGGYGQFAPGDVGEKGIPMMWEFWKSPPLNSEFTMRITAVAKADPQSPASVRHVDFTLPCLPKLTPNGEGYVP